MAFGTDSVGALELDYDIDLCETRRVSADPWVTRLEGQELPGATSAGDPDRTSRVVVNPFTGQVVIEPYQDPAAFLELPDQPAPASSVRFDLRTAALIIGTSLCVGLVVGSLVAVIALI